MSDLKLSKGWALAKIEELISRDGAFIDGDWVESKDQDPNGGVRLIQLADVGDGTFRNRSSRFLTKAKALKLGCTFLRKGDLLIARMPDPLGRACVFPLEGEDRFVTVVDVCIVRTSHEIASPEFLRSSINFLGTRKQIEELQIGTTRKRISRKNLATVTIPFPPPSEQKRIVAKIEELFSELDAGEESLRKAKRQLGIYRQSLLKQAFEGKLTAAWREQNPQQVESAEQILARIQADRLADYEKKLREFEDSAGKKGKGKEAQKRTLKPSEPKLIDGPTFNEPARSDTPVGWAVERIGNCPTDSLIGLVRSATEQGSDPAGTCYIKMDRIDMLGNVDLNPDIFVSCTEDEVERFGLRKGDILFNTRNSVELVGKTAVLRRDPAVPTVYNNNLMRIRLPDCLDPTFIGLQLCAKPFRQRMELVKKATTSVAAVYGKDFWPLPIAVCSLPEQREIVRLLDEQFTVIDQNEREIDTALKRSEALRQSILKKAFSGQLVPQDPDDEPAAVLLERIREERATANKVQKKRAAR